MSEIIKAPPQPAVLELLTRYLEMELSADSASVGNIHGLKGRARGQFAEVAYLTQLGGVAPGLRAYGGRAAMQIAPNGAGAGVRSPLAIWPQFTAPPTPGALEQHGRGMYRLVVTLAADAMKIPTTGDIGLTFRLSANGAPALKDWLSATVGGDADSGFGILMLGSKWYWVVKKGAAANAWAEQLELNWPVAIGEWCTIDVRIYDARYNRNARVELRLNGALVLTREFKGDGTALPGPWTLNRPTFLRYGAWLTNDDAAGPNLYVAEWREILGKL